MRRTTVQKSKRREAAIATETTVCGTQTRPESLSKQNQSVLVSDLPFLRILQLNACRYTRAFEVVAVGAGPSFKAGVKLAEWLSLTMCSLNDILPSAVGESVAIKKETKFNADCNLRSDERNAGVRESVCEVWI